ncbi:MAG: hypothetical protein IPK06_04845 [Ignavibacteriae bacterium]|nr:hypothetical protein [Ignavibacteriota bacterium]
MNLVICNYEKSKRSIGVLDQMVKRMLQTQLQSQSVTNKKINSGILEFNKI